MDSYSRKRFLALSMMFLAGCRARSFNKVLARPDGVRPPMPKGNLFSLRQTNFGDYVDDPLEYLADFLAQESVLEAGVATVADWPVNVYLVVDPLLGQKVFEDESTFGRGPAHERLRIAFGDGVFTATGSSQPRMKSALQTTLRPDAIKRMMQTVTSEIESFAQKLETEVRTSKVPVTMGLKAPIGALLQRAFVRAAFGVDVPDDVIVEMGATWQGLIGEAKNDVWELINLYKMINGPRQRAASQNKRKLDELLASLVAEARHAGAPNPEGRVSLIHTLLAYRTAEGAPLTDSQILDELRTMFAAGHETTASITCWIVHHLSLNGAAKLALRKEARERNVGLVGAQAGDFSAPLKVSQAIFMEALRLTPPAWNLPRTVVADGAKIGAFSIPKGAAVLLSPYIFHRHPRSWPEPTSFLPGRFLAGFGDGTVRKFDNGAYFPFGDGPRACPGRGFAQSEVTYLISRLYRNLDFQVAYEGMPATDAKFLYSPNEVAVRVSMA